MSIKKFKKKKKDKFKQKRCFACITLDNKVIKTVLNSTLMLWCLCGLIRWKVPKKHQGALTIPTHCTLWLQHTHTHSFYNSTSLLLGNPSCVVTAVMIYVLPLGTITVPSYRFCCWWTPNWCCEDRTCDYTVAGQFVTTQKHTAALTDWVRVDR